MGLIYCCLAQGSGKLLILVCSFVTEPNALAVKECTWSNKLWSDAPSLLFAVNVLHTAPKAHGVCFHCYITTVVLHRLSLHNEKGDK